MKYRIDCNTDQSSIVSFEANDEESLLAEVQDAFSDVINELICIDRPQGFFPDLASLSTEIYSSAQLKIKQKAQEYTLSCDNPCGVPDLVGLLLEVLENRRCSEQSDVDIGECALSMLKKFLIQGRWHFGLRDQQGCILEDPKNWPYMQTQADENNPNALFVGFSPIIWFGLDGEPPLDCWSIDITDARFQIMPYVEPYNVESWKSFWFNHFWIFDWNVLFNHEGEGVITWMFAECGMEEPEDEFDAVKKCCPIKLCEDDSKAILGKKISDFFVRHARYNCAEVGR